MLEVTPQLGCYCDNKHGNTVAAVKIIIEVAIGQTLDDSIEGTLKP